MSSLVYPSLTPTQPGVFRCFFGPTLVENASFLSLVGVKEASRL